jgi:hypothetical protein
LKILIQFDFLPAAPQSGIFATLQQALGSKSNFRTQKSLDPGNSLPHVFTQVKFDPVIERIL